MRTKPSLGAVLALTWLLTPWRVCAAPPDPQDAQAVQKPAAPSKTENVTVLGSRFKRAPTAGAFVPAPAYTPQSSDAAGFQPSIKPRSYCQSAFEDDVSGQPGNSQTQNGRCD